MKMIMRMLLLVAVMSSWGFSQEKLYNVHKGRFPGDLTVNDSLIVTDAPGGADTLLIWDDGTSSHIDSDNPLIIGATVTSTTFDSVIVNTIVLPDATGGADLGSASLEWGDVYLGDDKDVKFGADQDGSLGFNSTSSLLTYSGVDWNLGGQYILNEQGQVNLRANSLSSPYYRFDGQSGTMINAGDDDNFSFVDGEMTILASFNLADISGNPVIINKNNAGSVREYQVLVTSTGILRIYLFDSGSATNYSTWETATGVITTDTHYDIALVLSGTTVTCYVNSVPTTVTETQTGTGFSTFSNTSAHFVIGAALNAGSTANVNGQIDNVRMFNKALTASEVKQFMSGSVPYKYQGASQTAVNAGSFTVGKAYRIATVGTTDFTLIGAADNNVGTEFVATGAGSGTGTATPIGAVTEYDGSSMTDGTWYDKSGNDLDGTVSGASLENKVSALDVTDELILDSGAKAYLDGGGDTYLTESSADVLDVYVGGANMIKLTESTQDTMAVIADVSAFSGNVGIGTTGPTQKLQIAGTGGSDAYQVMSTDGTGHTGSNGFLFGVHGSSGDVLLLNYENTHMRFFLNNDEKVRFQNNGNVLIGTTTADATAAGVLAIANGTAPAAGTANQSYIYAKDVTASSELFVMDESGTETQISPHDPETGKWIFYSVNKKTGRVLRIEMEELMFDLAAEMSKKTGKTYIYETK